jgi:phenylacetate-CoA ligase
MQPGMFSDSMSEMLAVKKSIDTAIASITGLHMNINLVQPHTLERFEGKSRRVKDLRNLGC